MRNDEPVSRGKIIEWAEGIKEDPDVWLELAGYPLLRYSTIPEDVRQSIEQARAREEKVEVAFQYVHQVQPKLGSSRMSKLPVEAKLGIVRMYEELAHVKLLPDDLY